jgi:hypothetical protein
VYRKPTHTNLYLNAKFHHHPSNKQAVLSTPIYRARAICDERRLQVELVVLKDVFKENGYNDRQIHRALNRRPHLPQPDNEPHSVSFLPFVRTIFNRMSTDSCHPDEGGAKFLRNVGSYKSHTAPFFNFSLEGIVNFYNKKVCLLDQKKCQCFVKLAVVHNITDFTFIALRNTANGMQNISSWW